MASQNGMAKRSTRKARAGETATVSKVEETLSARGGAAGKRSAPAKSTTRRAA